MNEEEYDEQSSDDNSEDIGAGFDDLEEDIEDEPELLNEEGEVENALGLDIGLDDAEIEKKQPVENNFFNIMEKANSIEQHLSDAYMTKYEYTRIRGVRLQQLASGCPPFVVVPQHVTTIEEIFDLEFNQKRLPYIIKRPMPDGTFEYWKMKNLIYLPTLNNTKKPHVSFEK